MTEKLITAVVSQVVGGVVVACVSHALNKAEDKMKDKAKAEADEKAKAEEQRRVNLKAKPVNAEPVADDTTKQKGEFGKVFMGLLQKL